MPAINGYWHKGMSRADAPYLTLTAEVITKHLRDDLHIGLYSLGDDDTCWWVAADFDKNSAMLDALAYLKAARAYGKPCRTPLHGRPGRCRARQPTEQWEAQRPHRSG